MANKRVTELTAIDGDDVANDDLLMIVDVSDTTMAASGTNKKITVAELVTDSALTGAFWPNSSTALTGSNLANGDKLAVVDVGSPDVAKYITADELAQGSQFSSRFVAKADDRIVIPAQSFSPWYGTATLSGTSPAIWPGWKLDGSTAEGLATSFQLPSWWTTYHVDIWWVNDGAGAGDVQWQSYIADLAAGASINTSGSAITTLVTADAEDILKLSRVRTSETVASSELVFLGIYRDPGIAADTLANDVAFLCAVVTRAS